MSDHLEGVVGVILHVYVVISVIGYILDILDFYGITDLIIVENLVTIAVIITFYLFYLTKKISIGTCFSVLIYAAFINIFIETFIDPFSANRVYFFLRDSLFIVFLVTLSSLVISRIHGIILTVLYLVMIIILTYTSRHPFLLESIFLMVIIVSAYAAVIYYFVGVLEKFVNERERNIRIIGEKNQVVNETNALLEERQYYIEQLNEELKQQAEVLTDQSKQLMQKNKDLETLNKTKDKFLSILAHDLKNPFNILLGFSTILETKFEKLTDTKKLEFIKIIGSASKKTYNLLENLLQWTRSQSKTIEFHPQKLVIESAISENLNFFREMLKNKEIELTYLACNGSFVYADEKMINTVIRNLLSNAIKFTPNKGKINVSCKQTDQRVYVEITDNGIGMNKESVDSLFRIDKRNIAIGTDGETGSGLGLLLCKDFIEKNHGEIWATGEPEKGSTFSFFLPVFEEPDV